MLLGTRNADMSSSELATAMKLPRRTKKRVLSVQSAMTASEPVKTVATAAFSTSEVFDAEKPKASAGDSHVIGKSADHRAERLRRILSAQSSLSDASGPIVKTKIAKAVPATRASGSAPPRPRPLSSRELEFAVRGLVSYCDAVRESGAPVELAVAMLKVHLSALESRANRRRELERTDSAHLPVLPSAEFYGAYLRLAADRGDADLAVEIFDYARADGVDLRPADVGYLLQCLGKSAYSSVIKLHCPSSTTKYNT